MDLETRVTKLETWKSGNGAMGAELRIRALESGYQEIRERDLTEEHRMLSIVQEEVSKVRADIKNMLKEKPRAIDWVKTFALYIPSAVSLLIALLK